MQTMTSAKTRILDSRFQAVDCGFQASTGVLTIYMEKPEVPVGKSNGSRHSVWEAS